MNKNIGKPVGMKIMAFAILLLTSMIWGFAFVAQRVGSESLGAFSFNGIRFALGAVSLIPVALLFEGEQLERKKLKNTALVSLAAGTVLFIASALQQFGIDRDHTKRRTLGIYNRTVYGSCAYNIFCYIQTEK